MAGAAPDPAPAPAGLIDRVRAWLAADPDPDTRAELTGLVELAARGDQGAVSDLADRFAGRLQFGTAGLRGELGAGPMRMNRLVVRQATAGLVRFLRHELGIERPRLVVGYDARHKSDVFARDAAGVVVAAGGEALLFHQATPTPVVAYTVRRVAADAGVAVTASHNPPRDNGYKVYLGDGAQIVPPTDERIAAAIEAVSSAPIDVLAQGWTTLGDDAVEAYTAMAVGRVEGEGTRRDLVSVYTPLHGVGAVIATDAVARAGFPAPRVVAAQAEPDPDFPTVAFPNPEEPGALDLALADARRLGADIILANDPDADRLAVAVPDPHAGGAWRPLTGNEVGVLLADHLLRRTASFGAGRLVVTTVVSSRLLSKLAAEAGVVYAETLTGFKWIMRAALDRPDLRFVFGYEEALGYAVTAEVRDKDGITAALVFAELAAEAKAAGGSVIDRLDDIARRLGLHATAQVTIPGFGVVDRLRASPPTALSGRSVRRVVDLLAGDPLPPTDGMVVELEGDLRLVVRPSGTEPKTKAYLEYVLPVGDDIGATRTAAAAELEAVGSAVSAALGAD
ncbi:MAG: phospho-sugar mutase [Acidimicrobiales bacterium]